MRDYISIGKKVSQTHKSYGERHWAKRPEVRLKMHLAHLGKKQTQEQILKRTAHL